jgi:hypothetical protein
MDVSYLMADHETRIFIDAVTPLFHWRDDPSPTGTTTQIFIDVVTPFSLT